MRLVEQAKAAVDAGVELIQIRERDLEARQLADLVHDVLAVARGRSTRVMVNDRLDVAWTCGAEGVHLRADSVPTAEARRMAPRPFVIGRSVHSVEEARSAGDVDYLIAGTVFATPSKGEGHALLGTDGLRAIVAAARVPVLAIGGIASDRIEEIARTGAAGIAGIGLFLNESLLTETVSRARQRFDSAR